MVTAARSIRFFFGEIQVKSENQFRKKSRAHHGYTYVCMDGARQKVFENGFTFLHQLSPLRESKATSVQLFVQAGSIVETPGLRGACHLIEHMCFKGTPTFRDTESLFRNFQVNGATVNAYTEKRFTCYTMECPESNLADCLLTLSDMVMNSTFPRRDFEKETHVVVEENVKNMDDENVQIYNRLMYEVLSGTPYMYPVDDIAYHRGSGKYIPVRNSRGNGTSKNSGGGGGNTGNSNTNKSQTISKRRPRPRQSSSTTSTTSSSSSLLSYTRVVDLYRQFYIPGNMVLSVVTSASYDHCHRILNRSHWVQRIAKLPSGAIGSVVVKTAREIAMQPLVVRPLIPPPNHYVFQRSRELNTAHYCLGFQVGSLYDEKEADLLRFLAEYIGNTIGGKLPMLLREKYGLTYTSTCEVELFETRGVFWIYAETEPKRMFSSTLHGSRPGVANIILDFVKRLAQDGVDEQDVRRMKEYMRSKHELDSEDNDVLCDFHGYRCIMHLPPENYADFYKLHIQEIVTVAELNSLCRKLFLQSDPFQVYLGNGAGSSGQTRTRIVRKLQHK